MAPLNNTYKDLPMDILLLYIVLPSYYIITEGYIYMPPLKTIHIKIFQWIYYYARFSSIKRNIIAEGSKSATPSRQYVYIKLF